MFGFLFSQQRKKTKNTSHHKDLFGNRKTILQALTKGKHKSAIHQRHCSSSKCLMKKSYVGLTCPTYYINCDTSMQYIAEGVPPQFSLIICKCECTAAYYMGQIPQTLICKFYQCIEKSQVPTKKARIRELPKNVGEMFNSALSAAMAVQ